MVPNNPSFDERLQQLERKLFKSRLWSLLLTIMVVGLGLEYWRLANLSQYRSNVPGKLKIVKATEFDVVDNRGNVIAKFGQVPQIPTYAEISFKYRPFTKNYNMGVNANVKVGASLTMSNSGIYFGNYNGITFGSIEPNGTLSKINEPLSDLRVGTPMILSINAGTENITNEITIGNLIDRQNVWIDIKTHSIDVMQGIKTRVALGVVHLNDAKNGDQITTSPSRLTFFDKKGDQIWRVPYP